MVRKVDKTKLLTVVGIIIFLFGGAVRIFSHLTSSADNYIENFDVIILTFFVLSTKMDESVHLHRKGVIQMDETSQKIIDATMLLIRDKGYVATTTKDIAP